MPTVNMATMNDAMKKNRTDDEMYNDGAKRVSNPKVRSL